MLEVGVLVSGRGSNLEALLKSAERGYIKGARVAVVISNDPGARALMVARKHGVKAVALDSSGDSREAYAAKLANVLMENGVAPGKGLVLLAGFMKILPKSFVDMYEGRMMNIHPSLLPAFPGIRAQHQALSHGVKVAGCTVHFVVADVDAGPIILQKAVPVLDGDDEDALSARILRQEHKLYPLAVKLFAEGRLRTEGRIVRREE
ncbi:MAG TPA: phosphoribosylglycinamide formyltransferase [Nitrososphaerales archaeon]|nr:phosphoribosylglycinamide formyltransferase [Nitrososphaerales archaeon]